LGAVQWDQQNTNDHQFLQKENIRDALAAVRCLENVL
jgi:hypothetical protein